MPAGPPWVATYVVSELIAALDAPVRGARQVAQTRRRRRHVDDRTTTAIADDRDRVLAAEHRAAGVHRQDVVPDVDVHQLDQAVACELDRFRDGGIVVQDVKPSEGVDGGSDHRRDLGFLAHVDFDGDRAPTRGDHVGRDAFRFGGADVGDRHGGALGGEQPHGGLPDPGPSTGDDRHLPRDPAGLGALSIRVLSVRALISFRRCHGDALLGAGGPGPGCGARPYRLHASKPTNTIPRPSTRRERAISWRGTRHPQRVVF